jgi:hypothetical protein
MFVRMYRAYHACRHTKRRKRGMVAHGVCKATYPQARACEHNFSHQLVSCFASSFSAININQSINQAINQAICRINFNSIYITRSKNWERIANETYWDSSEARNLFMLTVEEFNALESIKNQIKLLHEGLKKPTSCLYLIADFKASDNQKLTEYQIWTLQQKCMVINLALSKAAEVMEKVQN